MEHLRSINRFILISLALLGMSVSSANAATYDLAGGGAGLRGANGVVVNGLTYNVEFRDGTCFSIYSGCDEATDFAFNSAAGATAASQALITQVFGNDDVYDVDPDRTRGIDASFGGLIYTPYLFLADVMQVAVECAANLEGNARDVAGCGNSRFQTTLDFRHLDDSTFARWTQVPAVPVPAAVWLFGTALIGLVGFSKRKSRNAA